MEDLRNETDFIKGFNDGYIIAKHAPTLSDHLSKVESEAPRIEGVQQGIKQYTLEQVGDFRPQWMKRDIEGKAPDQTKDRDIEPEH